MKLSDLRQDPDLWYRIRVLLYDLNNVKDAPSEKRLSSTMNELYISEPYFRDHEATKILTALIDSVEEPDSSGSISIGTAKITVEQALHLKLENFLEKRRASGDARPCGPHDMVPIYRDIFGITKEDLSGKRVLGRFRRSGLEKSSARTRVEAAVDETEKESSKQAGRKGKK